MMRARKKPAVWRWLGIGGLLLSSCSAQSGDFLGEQLLGIEEQISLDVLRDKGLTMVQELRLKDLDKELRALSKDIQEPLLQRSRYANRSQAVALILINYGMYAEARRYLDAAIEYEGNNTALFYYRGLCSAWLMKNSIEAERRSVFLQQALSDYGRSLEIKADYTDALYGLAVLQLFEVEDYEAAASFLDRYIASRKIKKKAGRPPKAKTLRDAKRLAKEYGSGAGSKDINAVLMRAQAAYGLGRLNEAAGFYDWAALIAVSPEVRERAEKLKNQVLQQNHYRSP
ncbi:MAG: hypothetical protein AAF975_01730 [Spirochaetota bacterium]